MKLTRKELRQLINESINEGFFDQAFGSIKQGLTNVFGQKYHIQFEFPRGLKNIKSASRYDSNMRYYEQDVYSAIYMTVRNHLGEFLSALNRATGINISGQGVSVLEKKSVNDIGFTLVLNNEAAKYFVKNNRKHVDAVQNAYDLGDYNQEDAPKKNQMVHVASRQRFGGHLSPSHRKAGILGMGSLNFLKIFKDMAIVATASGEAADNGLEAMSIYLGEVRRNTGFGTQEKEEHGDSSLGGMDIDARGYHSRDQEQIRNLLRTVMLSISYDLVALSASVPDQ